MPEALPRHGPDDDPTPDNAPAHDTPTLDNAPVHDTPAFDPLTELVIRLRAAGLDPDHRQLSDALWLARFTRRPAPQDAPEGAVPEVPGMPGELATGAALAEPPAPAPEVQRPPKRPVLDGQVSLYPMPRNAGKARAGALSIGVPAAPVLPSPLELQRALRRLQGYRSPAPPLRTVLDEAATAELSAQAGGLILPVHRAVTRRDARLQLVLDASSSMRVWHRMFDELEQVFGQLGAFSDIQTSFLHQGPDGEPTVSPSPEAQAAPLNSAERLSDPTGRRIVVLVSDCAGPLWHSGRAHRLLHHLSGQGPVAVLQPLPQRMWARTRLPVTFGELSRAETFGGALRVRTAGEVRKPGALPVPVLPPEPVALGAWARLLSGAGSAPYPARSAGSAPTSSPPRPPARTGGVPRWSGSAGSARAPHRPPDASPCTSRRPPCACR
ncbi:SAV_2336 N-terminal domain-related protein [Streptomyces sp. ST1020]|uniref:SAV_2336 N-terminal domain-related protein n=1 Tax=Streptomyces sp. ST1020 TaxID=1848901 RepID=UPI0034C612AD